MGIRNYFNFVATLFYFYIRVDMKIFLLSSLILLSTLLLSSCKKDNPVIPPAPEPPKAVTIRLVDVSCTEAFIKITAADSLLPLSISLMKDDNSILSFILTKTDTVVIDTTLKSDQFYSYQTIETINGKEEKSDTLQVKALSITSNNFTWQTFTFGDPNYGSSNLNDVAIIDENNIWAVGEIYNDTTGQAYNAVHWGGNEWLLERIPYYYQGQPFFNPITAIFAFGKDDIWFGGNGVIHWDGNQYNPIPIPTNIWGPHQINKIWGVSSNNLYIVGNDGKIAHYQNGQWSKIESGTTTNINGIWGAHDASSGMESVLGVASNILHQGEYRLLSISGGNASDTLNWPYTDWLKEVWFKNQYSPVYICGSGVKIYKNNTWSEINIPNYFTEAIRGSDYNNIFVVGDFGTAAHFNGASWQTISELSSVGKFLGVSTKGNTVVICGYSSSGGAVGSAVVVVGKK